jgi:hypothetical protein
MSRLSSESLPRPEEFPVGSEASRAAARALLESRERGVRRITIILDAAMRPPQECPDPNRAAVGPWSIGKDGNLWRTAFIPRGIDEEEKRWLLGDS